MAWSQLSDIRRQALEDSKVVQSAPPVACPVDGNPLDIGQNGLRNCPLGNYTWRG
jgi:hypothetical protein